ncbi:hypothetical protein LTS18_000857, partial [Coniosporium uncinatum]
MTSAGIDFLSPKQWWVFDSGDLRIPGFATPDDLLDAAFMEEPAKETPKNTPRKGSARATAKKSGVRLGGGQEALIRARIVMHLIALCDGVFPGGGEMNRPFVKAYQEVKGAKQQPDSATIERTIAILVQEGKLRRLTFTFNDKRSKNDVQKKILITSDVTPTDPRVRDVQRQMIRQYPVLYVPPQCWKPEWGLLPRGQWKPRVGDLPIDDSTTVERAGNAYRDHGLFKELQAMLDAHKPKPPTGLIPRTLGEEQKPQSLLPGEQRKNYNEVTLGAATGYHGRPR